MRPPCYDIYTKQHCPDRFVGCHAICLKWGKYAEINNAEYKKRLEKSRAVYVQPK